MSSMKNGFSSLNRWLGKKSKDKTTAANDKLSKSNTNLSLSISTANINEASQLEYNRITPLPAATSNAPFEQTFRITVLLPKDQLYVTRLGARVPLSKLLELVCENKLLNADKYEFRNPVDPSQVFSLKLTIGAVGLSEVRLCHKTDPYDTFNTDEVIKLRSTNGLRGSFSSSEFSSRNSKHTTKTISPYSSSNSLNSLESSTANYAHVPAKPCTTLPTTPKVTAPPRKKRAAPRPPSQNPIPEKLNSENTSPSIHEVDNSLLLKKDYFLSTPDLHSTVLSTLENGEKQNINIVGKIDQHINTDDLYARVEKKNVRNLCGGSVQNLCSPTHRDQSISFPEPSPRKRLIQIKKKSAPAPPNRGSLLSEDTASLAPSIPEERYDDEDEVENSTSLPQPVPRLTTTTLLNATTCENSTELSVGAHAQTNVSKVMLNRTPTPEPRSLTSDTGEMEHILEASAACDDDDTASKQADSGIGEPVPSPLPDSLQSEGSTQECKSTFESSSDDDEMIRVYNFKLGKTVIQHLDDHKVLETVITPEVESKATSGESTPATLKQQSTPCPSETSSWNFCIPISPPPNFADERSLAEALINEKSPDSPITPKIKERPVLDFASIKAETEQYPANTTVNGKTTTKILEDYKLPSQDATSPLDEIVDELSAIINHKGVNSLIKKPSLPQAIEAAKPNTLTNFSIDAIEEKSTNQSKQVSKTPIITPEVVQDAEKLYRRKPVARADSLHTTTVQAIETKKSNGLHSRSSSYISLTKLEQNGDTDIRYKSSSSELSIAASPSLQSLEIIKTILNSRKNSLVHNNSDGESPKSEEPSVPVLKPKKAEIQATKAVQETNLPKVYRYSGPPSINLTTWNERPKAQVAIKNEGDYIFGGNHVTIKSEVTVTSLHNNRTSMPSKLETTTQRMGIPDKEFHVPITVKPLKDVTVENTPKNNLTLSNTSSLPRNKINRLSTSLQVSTAESKLKRSTSITALEANKAAKVLESSKTVVEAPFGQNTLRKTGLKEKILAKEEVQEVMPKALKTTTETANTISTAKLELKVQRAASSNTSQYTPPPPPPPNISIKNLKPLKSSSRNSKSLPTSPDVRDELLDAIRSFKREKLKRRNS